MGRHRSRAACASCWTRHGIGTLGEGQEWTTIRRMLFRDGVLLDAASIRDVDPRRRPAARRATTRSSSPSPRASPTLLVPTCHPQALDPRCAGRWPTWRREADLGALAALFARRNSQGEFAAEPGEVSRLFVAQQRAQMAAHGAGEVVRAHRVDGGLERLIDALVAELSNEWSVEVSYDELVERVQWTRRRGRGGHHTAHDLGRSSGAGVLAGAAAPGRVRPAAADGAAAAVQQLGYGTITKTAVQYPNRSWPAGYATTAARGPASVRADTSISRARPAC